MLVFGPPHLELHQLLLLFGFHSRVLLLHLLHLLGVVAQRVGEGEVNLRVGLELRREVTLKVLFGAEGKGRCVLVMISFLTRCDVVSLCSAS